MTTCLEENEIVDLVTGALPEARAAEAEAHIDTCPACRLVLIELARIFELRASALPEEPPSVSAEVEEDDVELPLVLQPPALARGQQIGRYLVLEVLGSGAMGIVYAAYDPELDRKVALKLLRERKVDTTKSERLLREARATAKLAHPNVVVVHDVGTHDDAVFMAMEFVDGGTLGEWQQGERSRDQLLAAYADAATGLAAAHAVGLVHRDFKPANVLVGGDGRVRVTDFGLARLHVEDSMEGDVFSTLETSQSVEVLTKTGAIVGTPAYMSPEQFEGAIADARSDQFSFCVALYEALCGERPFSGRTFSELSISVSKGQVGHNAAFEALPSGLRRALLRGLQPDPSARFPDMHALLPALSMSSTSSRWLPAVAAGGVALGVGVFGFSMGANQEPSPCADEQDAFASVWTPARRDALAEKLRGSGHAYADDVAAGVQSRVDGYTQQWAAAFAPACEVSVDSAETVCLRARRRDLEQLLMALEQGDAEVAEFAVQAVERLRSLDACGSGGSGVMLPPPTPPATLRDAVASFDQRLSLATALEDTRQFEAALDEATRVRDEAAEVDYAPTVAEAELMRGRALGSTDQLEEAEAALVRSVRAAWSAGHERVALEAAMELVLVAGVENNKPEVGAVWADFGASSLQRVGGAPRVDALLAEATGALAHHRGDFEQALRDFERALEIRTTSLPPEHTLLATTHARLAATLISTQAYTEGLEHADQALVIHRQALGSQHPTVMRAQSLRGAALLKLGRLEETQTALDEALRIGTAVYGASDLRVADVHHALGGLASQRGDHETAMAAYAKVLEAHMTQGGLKNPVVAILLHNLGNVAFRADKYDEAEDYLERALEARSISAGPDHPSLGSTLATLTVVAKTRGQCDVAVRHAERALDLVEDPRVSPSKRTHIEVTAADAMLCAGQSERALTLARGAKARADQDPDLASMRIWAALTVSDAELAVGHRAESEEAARQALDVARDATERSAASFRIARATVKQDRDAAVAMARAALSDASSEDRARIEDFLAQH